MVIREETKHEQVAHLLRRAGFGGTKNVVDSLAIVMDEHLSTEWITFTRLGLEEIYLDI